MARVAKRAPEPTTAGAAARSKQRKCTASCSRRCKYSNKGRRCKYSSKNQPASRRKSCAEITKKGKKGFQQASKVKKAIKVRILKESSRNALALVIHEQVNENVNLTPPEVLQCPENSPVPNEDLASS
ncbi:uncharacterized protein LOC110321063 [Mus pahari]|uniref:uncharacterized protein LOC110321063 n=1 Tax=Mus pahari TaxID=10093 RepID=UPI000A31158E|nr:uncharacterized protein LOC110321063 [Mus pahari]